MAATSNLRIFLSFRRGDTTLLAGRIKDRLVGYYKKGFEVSDDLGYIPTAAAGDTAAYIRDRLRDFNVLLVAIGPNWLNIANRARQRRLDIPDDSVRLIIQESLGLPRPIIVALAPSTVMPTSDQLPPNIKALAEVPPTDIVQFHDDTAFNADMRKLYRLLSSKLEARQRPAIPMSPDDSQPSLARQQVLKDFKDTGRPPYPSFRIQTLGELEYIARRSGGLNANNRRPVSLQGVDMSYANFNGANLNGFNLQGADLTRTALAEAQLESANLTGIILESTDLSKANLKGSKMSQLDLRGANLQGCDLSDADLDGANLSAMDLTQVLFGAPNLQGADLSGADMHNVDLSESVLEDARLEYADLSGANLTNTNLRGAQLTGANFSGAKVDGTTFSSIDTLDDFIVDAKTTLNRAAWGTVSIRQIGRALSRQDRIAALQDTVRINHLIAEALRKRGMLPESSDYRLRAQQAQRKILFLQGRLGAWLFSWALNLLSGYGERPVRALISYFVTVATFALIYFFGPISGLTNSEPTTILQSVVLSFAAFHGSGLLPASLNLTDPLSVIAAVESLVGLFIELIFIATFSRRFFGN